MTCRRAAARSRRERRAIRHRRRSRCRPHRCALPAHGVVGSDDARHSHAENLFQLLRALQSAMRVAALRRFAPQKRWLPGRPESDLQESDWPASSVAISADSHFFHQAGLAACLKSRSMRPFACGECAAIHSMSSSARARPNCVRGRSVVQLLLPLHGPGSHEQAVFIGVERQRPPVALQPSAQGAQIFFTWNRAATKRPQTRLVASSINGNQVAGGAAIFQPAEGRAVHHHQFAESAIGAAATHAPDFTRCRRRACRSPGMAFIHFRNVSRLTGSAVSCQMFGGQRRTETVKYAGMPQLSAGLRCVDCPRESCDSSGRPRSRCTMPVIPHLVRRRSSNRRTCRSAQPQTARRIDLPQMTLARLRATPSIAPALWRSTRSAPLPSGPPAPRKADISTLHKPDILTLQLQHRWPACQRKVEMSGFSPDRNVRFHGFLQG